MNLKQLAVMTTLIAAWVHVSLLHAQGARQTSQTLGRSAYKQQLSASAKEGARRLEEVLPRAIPELQQPVINSDPHRPQQGFLRPRDDIKWYEVLNTPRIGGRITAIAVDQENANRIYVGTEEGTLIKSLDGGITWDEQEITPFVMQDRAIGVFPPPKPDASNVDTITAYEVRPYIPYSTEVRDDFVDIAPPTHFAGFARGFTPNGFDVLPFDRPNIQFMRAGVFPRGPSYRTEFFQDVVKSRRRFTNPVNRINICHGSRFPLVISTLREVWGSDDDGRTFTRLNMVQQPAKMYHAVCDSRFPNHMMVNNDFGSFYSNDGGLTFQHITMGRGEAVGASAIFVPPYPEEKVRIVFIADDWVYVGDPNEKRKRPKFLYPDWTQMETGPWKTINWGAVDSKLHMWLATQDGLRKSESSDWNLREKKYVEWSVVDVAYFDQQWIEQVMVGANDKGGDRVAVISRSKNRESFNNWVLASDDGGKSWYNFFYTDSRREFKQMASAPAVTGVPPRWWVATSGQIFASVKPSYNTTGNIDRAAARWAAQKLRLTPSFEACIEATWYATRLHPNAEAEMLSKLRNRNFIPVEFDLVFNGLSSRRTQSRNSVGINNSEVFAIQSEEATKRSNFTFFIQGIWEIRDTPLVLEQFNATKNAIVQMRRFERDLVQDAWHERYILLQRIAEGMDDPLQIQILKERIEGLEAVLEVWTRQSMTRLFLATRDRTKLTNKEEN